MSSRCSSWRWRRRPPRRRAGGTWPAEPRITSDTKLRADLTNCPGDGLVIGKDGITLDLGRRTIDGTGAEGSHGIRLNGRRGVKIKGGTVQEFADGRRTRRVRRQLAVPASPCAASAGRGVNALNGSDRNVFSGVARPAT